MSGSLPSRWLLTILFLAVLPAASQTQFSFTEDHSTTDNTAAATEEAGDIPVTEGVPEQQIQLPPEDLADIYMVRQRFTAAIREYQKIQNPSAVVWNKLGIAYQQMFALKEAERCYKQSLKLNPHNPKVLNNLATVQDGMKNFSAAEKNYRKAIKLEPNSAVMLKNLGTNLLMQHKYEKGAELYHQALAMDPAIFGERFGFKVNSPAPKDERGTAAYFKARTCARLGLNDCAISYLIKAFNEGAATVEKVAEEEDFSSLRGTPALTRLLSRQQ
jgi:tetratricopeptide (TPR) repeat protein